DCPLPTDCHLPSHICAECISAALNQIVVLFRFRLEIEVVRNLQTVRKVQGLPCHQIGDSRHVFDAVAEFI
ncbi:MAG: hypothetical protein B7Y78_01350, partial [Caulobacter sp. 35-67-4]